ncbi:MAG TPA: tRNA (adenosine(37)-N6)-threonylcarbamoyltransferase complex dimerization subunit type 1 TsaB [Cellvibrionaceae bacterium]|nr:tRNA (adenosine(37)-N6)-threonylcarbamoyltransferase complex dimerization subunit type 1 TsaB [Cellvibrionaceae bacterium]HMW70957.1 tRNA (adenosine(37)-N6)-threonylcarbamoyltransferase complex dimerization subunit type 1 TsaB [Cellvibrionaceae bacterium]HMY38554.1 tRNA (adenosine(37)-N6)-threonylcarbamoyltransferase complex dimerization subunit type 1 TsaB [Marinagarivorans sp.]HNG61682.1 tRNA (adenosine(37)-N6)-threonylcarbamoyltransferase complex dimerization subunit type 1 TsaB [Cellvibri
MLTILAIEASAEACSVALTFRGLVFARTINRLKSHSLVILPAVDELLAEANCAPSDIDAIAYDCGPGAFTGLRIGLSFAQGLAMGWRKPLVPVASLACLAHQTINLRPELNQVVALLDARMSELYAAVYRRAADGFTPIKEAFLCSYAQADELLGTYSGADCALVGLGVRETSAALKAQFVFVDATMNPEASALLVLAELAFRQGQAVPVEQAELVYVRNSVTWDKHQLRRNRDQ